MVVVVVVVVVVVPLLIVLTTHVQGTGVQKFYFTLVGVKKLILGRLVLGKPENGSQTSKNPGDI